MSIFYNIRLYKRDNIRHLLVLLSIFLASFVSVGSSLMFFSHSVDLSSVWSTLRMAPMIFGTLTYVILGISLSYFSYKSLVKIICFTAVVTDTCNRRLMNAFLFNLFLLNFFASSLIVSYIVIYFLGLPQNINHILYIMQVSFILPITYCMRILESCVDKIINLETAIETSCLRFIKSPK